MRFLPDRHGPYPMEDSRNVLLENNVDLERATSGRATASGQPDPFMNVDGSISRIPATLIMDQVSLSDNVSESSSVKNRLQQVTTSKRACSFEQWEVATEKRVQNSCCSTSSTSSGSFGSLDPSNKRHKKLPTSLRLLDSIERDVTSLHVELPRDFFDVVDFDLVTAFDRELRPEIVRQLPATSTSTTVTSKGLFAPTGTCAPRHGFTTRLPLYGLEQGIHRRGMLRSLHFNDLRTLAPDLSVVAGRRTSLH